MSENLIIFNARIVTPIGFSARKGEGNVPTASHRERNGRSDQRRHYLRRRESVVKIGMVTINTIGIITPGGTAFFRAFVDSHTHFVFGGERSEELSWRLKGESYMSIMERGGRNCKYRQSHPANELP